MKNFRQTPSITLANSSIVLSSFILIITACSKDESARPSASGNRSKPGIGKSVNLISTEATQHNITVEDARAFIRYYYETTIAGMGDEEKKQVVTSVYFPLDALENYLAAMKAYNSNTSGIRVYFARYDRSHLNELKLKDKVLKLDHQNLNTVLFVATEQDETGYAKDIIGRGAYQPFNAGVSCPPLPSSYCKGLYCPLVEIAK